jgi:hypothetical protein
MTAKAHDCRMCTPPSTFCRVRGDYDKTMTGVRAFTAHGIQLSLSAVVLRSTLHTWTNLARPGDPYGTGQQLYRRPCPKLAAFTVAPAAIGRPVPAATGEHD